MKRNYIPTGRSYTQRNLQRCGYIILNIRNMFWTECFGKCFHLHETINLIIKPERSLDLTTVLPARWLKGCTGVLKDAHFYALVL